MAEKKYIQEYSTPTNIKVGQTDIIPCVLDHRISRNPNEEIISYKTLDEKGEIVWKTKKANEFHFDIQETAKGVLASGIKRGNSVAIIAGTSYEWALMDFVLLSIGCIVIPIYETSSTKQIEYILKDSKTKYVFVQNKKLKDKVRAANNKVEIQVFDENCIGALKIIGESITTETFKKEKSKGKSSDIATIVYTSGSTGTPKGVELTHFAFLNIIYNGIKGMPELLARQPQAKLLLFLPLAHVFARYLLFQAFEGTTKIALTSDIKSLVPDLQDFKPTYMLAVPRVFEKVYNSASQKAGGGLKGLIFKAATNTAVKYSKTLQKGKKPTLLLTLKHSLFDNLVYSTLRKVMGGNVEYAVAGGAPMNSELTHFYCGLGLPLLEGYGLTESAAPTMVNRPNHNIIGSVGQPLPGVCVKLGENNELLIKSKQLANGYHNQEDLSIQTFKNGWLYTGDQAKILQDGSVILTGRIKDIIVTAGGKNVSPSPLEDSINMDPFISASVVLGDRKPFISALITIDKEYTKTYFDSKGLVFPKSNKELIQNPFILNKVSNAIDKANETVSNAESIKKWIILEDEFSEENGLMTPTSKIKRNKVIETYSNIISKEIYSGK